MLLRWMKRDSLKELIHKKLQDAFVHLLISFACWISWTMRSEAPLSFLKFPQADLLMVSHECNGIRPLNLMRHLPFSLLFLDPFFSIKSARCLTMLPGPSMRKLPPNPRQYSRKVRSHLWKQDTWNHLIQNHFKEARSYAPQTSQSLDMASVFSIPSFSPSLLWPLMASEV